MNNQASPAPSTEHDPINPYRSLVETANEFIVVNTAQQPTAADVDTLRRCIGEASSVVCELGSGSGRHLLTLAEQSPDTLHIGMELRYKRAYRTVEKAMQRGLTNVRVLRADARYLPLLFPPQSLQAIYINFPDPWDKRRWFKNRLIQEPFVHQMSTLIRNGGVLSYKTDHPEYFSSAVAIIEQHENFKQTRLTLDLAGSPWAAESVPTEFELLFQAQKLPIHYALFERV